MIRARAALATLVLVVFSRPLPAQPTVAYPQAKHGGNYMHNFYFPPAPSSTPWAPSWAPDGKSIAVAMSGSIWRVDPETGAAFELTAGPKYHAHPDWSPDGKWIVYTADDGGKSIQLEILNVATGESHALTDDEFLYADPVFAPTGDRLAYVSTKPNGYFNVYVRRIESGRFSGEEIAVTKDHSYPSSRLYFGEWDMHITPAWLPNGKELLLVSNRDVPLGSGNVLRVPAMAGGIEEAETVLEEQTLYRAVPDVSLDGKRFIYSSTRGTADQFSNLYVQPTAGGEPYKMTFFANDAFHPRWSPDGEWIAFISNAEGLPQLALLETYGGSLRTIHITDRRWKRPMGVLSVRTVEGATGELTGSRIHLKASDGKFYAPSDAYARASSRGDFLFHHAGSFRVEVPAGRVSLDVVKGFEFHPKTTTVEVEAGEVHAITVALERLTDLSARGWYSGSTHVHMNYGGNLGNTLENLMMMSEAEDQDIVNEQVANKDSSGPAVLRDGGGRIRCQTGPGPRGGQEYRPPFYGRDIGVRDHLISPFTTGWERRSKASTRAIPTCSGRRRARGRRSATSTPSGASAIRSRGISAAARATWSTPPSGRPTPSSGRTRVERGSTPGTRL
jgi:dipeptidyl aminopeptidase/acylaminoacyl peptidase